MIVFYITGTSSGIGKAIAEQALEIEGSMVYGFSRTCSIDHKNYKHLNIDLSDSDNIQNLEFEIHESAHKVVLINNAGMIGDIKPVGRQNGESIVNLFNLNTICPAILSNQLINKYAISNASIVIVNISSGAARHPIESWSTYCASKAAVDMYSQVLQAENGYDSKKIRIFSIAPGIVDTNMQQQLRNSNANDFPLLDKFVEYQKKGQLVSPSFVGQKILKVIEKPELYQNVLLDVRQLE
jgi:benzil reductase ((S)-benzoin forming)